jgi:hypothetical protein
VKTSSFLLLAGTILLVATALDRAFKRECQDSDELLDKGLDETFPASDPTSTQDFSAPEDRGQAPRGYAL